MSKDIRHDLEKIIKKNEKGEIGDPEKDIIELFVKRFPLPPAMAEDLALYVMSIGEKERAVEVAYDLEALFSAAFDVNETVLTPEDWEAVRDLANGYGEEIDLDLLTYVMRKVVEYGAFN